MAPARSNPPRKAKAKFSGISKRDDQKAKVDNLRTALENAENVYDNADEKTKREIESQRATLEREEKQLETMNVDEEDVQQEHDAENSNANVNNGPRNNKEQGASDSSQETSLFYNDDSDIGLVEKIGDTPLREPGHLEQYFKGRFGHYYGVYRYGPANAARHNIRFLAERNSLPEELRDDPSKDMRRNSRIPDNGVVRGEKKGQIHRILGVAWENMGEFDRMDSLSPANWPTGKTTLVPRGPPMVVKVRWFDDEGPVSWEWRGAAKRLMYPRQAKSFYSAPRPIEYASLTLIAKGERIQRADFLIIDTAVRLEKRHEEWVEGQREGANRDPTPGLPLKEEEEEEL